MIKKITQLCARHVNHKRQGKHVLLIAFGLCFLTFTAAAQENFFKISCQYRLRPELRRGYRTLAADNAVSAFFIGQRARLGFEYKQDFVHINLSITDGRTWGEETPQTKGINGLQVNEVWLELTNKKGFSMKMGRQELTYDDQRLLGNLDWGNLSKSHDALVLKYGNKVKKFNLHVGAAFNQSGEPFFKTTYTVKNYKFLSFVWVNKTFEKAHSTLSFIALGHGLTSIDTTSPTMKTSVTFGPVFTYANKGWIGLIGAYLQEGKNESNKQVNAFMINAYAELHKKSVLVGLGFDWISGSNDKTKATRSQCFNTLYGSNHKFYGYMDYFLSMSTDTKQRGLMDTYIKSAFGPYKNFTPMLDIHYFALANSYTSATQSIKKGLGVETDFILDYKPKPFMNIQLGYSNMMGTKSMVWLKGGSKDTHSGWLYLIVKVSPTLFLHEIETKLKA